MSSKLAKKLKREFKKSPGKAAVLALLAVVAGWFWAPLVKGWFGGATPPPVAASATIPDPGVTATATTATPGQAQPTYTWKQIAEAIDRDPRMLAAEHVALPRDPFHGKVVEVVKQEEPQAEPTVVAIDLTPDAAGLVLSSTIVGPKHRAARVNGKTYRVGDTVEAATPESTLEFTLVEVRGRSIVMARNGKQYELKMIRPNASMRNVAAMANEAVETSDFDPSLFPVAK